MIINNNYNNDVNNNYDITKYHVNRFISNDTVSLWVSFEIQESIIDAPPKIPNPFNKLVNLLISNLKWSMNMIEIKYIMT